MKCLEHCQVVSVITAYPTTLLLNLLAYWKSPIPRQRLRMTVSLFTDARTAQDGYGIQFCPKIHKGRFVGGFLRNMCFPYKRRDGREVLFLLTSFPAQEHRHMRWESCTCCSHPVSHAGDIGTLGGWGDGEMKSSSVSNGIAELLSQPSGCLPRASLYL